MASARRVRRHRGRRPLRVAVASDQTLLAESVSTTLRHEGWDAVVVAWPGARGPVRRPRSRPRRPDVGVMLASLDRTSRILAAQELIEGLPVPWLVLAGVPRGPAWGAVLDSGARVVAPSSTTLDELVALLGDVGAGRRVVSVSHKRELLREWREHNRQHEELAARARTLSTREQQVLRRLHAGETVRTIAEKSEVTESTVRSQVKAILRKLDVNSQIAAVASYEDLLDW